MAPQIISRATALAQGLKRYFTGEQCKRGHVCERQVSNLTCMECTCEKQRARWPNRDKEADRSKRRARYATDPVVRQKKLDYNQMPQRKAYAAAWYQANKDRLAEKRRAEPGKYRESNIASAKRWAEANPEKAREHSRMNRRNRRARAKDAGGTHTAADLKEILTAQGGRCAYCRADLRKTSKHVDHILPLARGGSNGRSNIQYLCQPCNQTKNWKDPNDFARSLGLLI